MPCHTRMKTLHLQGLLWLCLLHIGFVFSVIEPGYLDFDNLPDTNFSCVGKVIGGYYADLETSCQMFHVCTIGQLDEPMDIRFLCLNGTVFDQETRVCERIDEVDCSKSERFYHLNLELYGNTAPPIVEEPDATESPKVLSISSTATPKTTTTARTTRRTFYTTAVPAVLSSTHSTPKVITSNHFPVHSGPDIRFNPEEINIRLTPISPPIIKSPSVSFQQQAFNGDSRITVTTHSAVFKSDRTQKNAPTVSSSSTQKPKSVVNYGLQHNPKPTYQQQLPYDYSYQQTEISDDDYHTDLPSGEYSYQESVRTDLSQYDKNYQTTTKSKQLFSASTTKRTENTLSYPSSTFSPSMKPHYNYQRTDKPPSLQLPLPPFPTLPPLTFSSPAPFSLTRHIETKRSNDRQQRPRIVVSASASVSDASGRRLNYSLGTIGTSHIIGKAPTSYDDYKEDDVGLDPFYHDVPKVSNSPRRRRDLEEIVTPTADTTTEDTSETTRWTPPDYVDDNYEPLTYKKSENTSDSEATNNTSAANISNYSTSANAPATSEEEYEYYEYVDDNYEPSLYDNENATDKHSPTDVPAILTTTEESTEPSSEIATHETTLEANPVTEISGDENVEGVTTNPSQTTLTTEDLISTIPPPTADTGEDFTTHQEEIEDPTDSGITTPALDITTAVEYRAESYTEHKLENIPEEITTQHLIPLETNIENADNKGHEENTGHITTTVPSITDSFTTVTTTEENTEADLSLNDKPTTTTVEVVDKPTTESDLYKYSENIITTQTTPVAVPEVTTQSLTVRTEGRKRGRFHFPTPHTFVATTDKRRRGHRGRYYFATENVKTTLEIGTTEYPTTAQSVYVTELVTEPQIGTEKAEELTTEGSKLLVGLPEEVNTESEVVNTESVVVNTESKVVDTDLEATDEPHEAVLENKEVHEISEGVGVKYDSVPEVPKEVGEKSVVQDIPEEVYEKSVVHEIPERVHEKFAVHEIPEGVHEKSVVREVAEGVHQKSVVQEIPEEVYEKSVVHEIPERVHEKSAVHDIPEGVHEKSFEREIPEGVHEKSVVQEIPEEVREESDPVPETTGEVNQSSDAMLELSEVDNHKSDLADKLSEGEKHREVQEKSVRVEEKLDTTTEKSQGLHEGSDTFSERQKDVDEKSDIMHEIPPGTSEKYDIVQENPEGADRETDTAHKELKVDELSESVTEKSGGNVQDAMEEKLKGAEEHEATTAENAEVTTVVAEETTVTEIPTTVTTTTTTTKPTTTTNRYHYLRTREPTYKRYSRTRPTVRHRFSSPSIHLSHSLLKLHGNKMSDPVVSSTERHHFRSRDNHSSRDVIKSSAANPLNDESKSSEESISHSSRRFNKIVPEVEPTTLSSFEEVPITEAPLSKSANPTEPKNTKGSPLPTTPITKTLFIPRRFTYDVTRSFNCFGKEMNKFYEDPRDCRLFHYCTPGYSDSQVLDMKFVCDYGTYFDSAKLICTKVKPQRCK